METCVWWADDNGDLWGGHVAEYAMRKTEPEKAARLRQPEANTLQERCERALAYARKRGMPARIIVLKGRRSGCSLFWAKVFDLECKHIGGTRGVAMADQYDRSAEMHSMLSQFASSDAVPWGFGVETTDTVVRWGNGSVIKKETALDKNAGRGAGNRLAWFSEAAHYPSDGVRDARALMLATLNTIPQKPGTIVVAESTANGPEGWFPETWNAAEWPEDETYWHKWESPDSYTRTENVLWLRVFAAWFEIPRNAIPCTKEEAAHIFSRLSPSEREGVQRYQWRADQIKWRRTVIANNFGNDERMFDQEYPHSPESAFIATGSPAFNRVALAQLRREAERAQDQWMHGIILAQGATPHQIVNGDTKSLTVKFARAPEEEAWFSMIEPPMDGCSYIFPADPASERDVTDGKNELDRMSLLILRAGYWKPTDKGKVWVRPRVVARIRRDMMDTHPSAEETTYMVALASKLYGEPCIPVETNKGEWCIAAFRRAGLNLYRTRVGAREVEQGITSRIGFVQTAESRTTIIKDLQSAVHGTEMEDQQGNTVRIPAIEVEDLGIVQELETFVRDKKGKYLAASGKHDDDVLCLAMGLHLIEHAVTYRMQVRRRR